MPAFTIAEVPFVAKLDQNESPLDIPDAVKQTLLETLAEASWNRYPQPKDYELIKERFGEVIGQPKERIVLTAGGDQMILLAYLAAGGPGRRARVFEPTYPMFAALGRTTGTDVDRVVLDADFDMTGAPLSDVELLCLVSPNNPTGNGPGRALIQGALKNNCLVFIDEAYADYAKQTIVDTVPDHPNLLVARSLSKSMLAGVRLGYGVGHPTLINVLERLIFAPYHLNAMQLAVAANYDIIKPHTGAMVSRVVAERERVQKRLVEMGLTTWKSQGNFILFEVEGANSVYTDLLNLGVRLRDVSTLPGLDQHLRVTIGTPEENDRFLEAAGELLTR